MSSSYCGTGSMFRLILDGMRQKINEVVIYYICRSGNAEMKQPQTQGTLKSANCHNYISKYATCQVAVDIDVILKNTYFIITSLNFYD